MDQADLLPGLRPGSCLEHGLAHAEDHRRWSRRSFLSCLGLAVAGSAFTLGRTPIRAFGQAPLLSALRALETERILVLVQLSGGNDGLNTVVPVEDDRYYNARPTLAIARNQTLSIAPELGLHPSLASLEGLYGDGRLAIVQNVGYPSPDLSHFRSTDVWMSARDAGESARTGWVGRYLDATVPDFADDPPPYPLAVQIGGSSLLFQGPSAHMGMALASVELFERIAASGQLYDTQAVPATTYGTEMAFVRAVANESFQYAGAVQQASEQGVNTADYPGNNPLARDLSVIARLIKGNLGARVYHVSLNGFDTHANQAAVHAALLNQLAEGIKAFHEDLGADWRDRVLVMTFSEFGRRPQQNGSFGTDHGTAAPLFLLGDVVGGPHGPPPDLANLVDGNLAHDVDFRAVYTTVLQDWFGVPADVVAAVLGPGYDVLPLIAEPARPTANEPAPLPRAFSLLANYPNPFHRTTTLSFTLGQAGPVRLRVFDVQGRLVRTLIDGSLPPGSHRVTFDADRLPSGAYLYRLETPHGAASRTMTLVR
ncbi:hypothetical protein AWN76_002650 [Rhodothermaceae bacterium RA]|nr:hypothetical protein AWN76_002650 [Rhodothermaceae bacterium RA]